MNRLAKEEQGLRDRYERRRALNTAWRYSVFEPAYLLSLQQRDRVLLRELRANGISELGALKILDLGCGSGQDLLRFLLWGAKAEHLTGIDLLPERCEAARRLHPSITVIQGNVAALPFGSASFDLVTQFTTFSSILDPVVRAGATGEITRVLVPGGHVIWYDFWLNPVNPDSRGIRPKEIRNLFPAYVGRLRRLTLAPPVARVLVGWSPLAVQVLQGFWPLQTHYLGVLQRPALSA